MTDVSTDKITVHFDQKICIHARKCVLGLPQVFDLENEAKGWIFPDEADPDAIARVIEACPSGALTYTRHDGGREETPPPVNTARLWEDGPNELRGDIRIEGAAPRTRAVLCRCGLSSNKPFCDNSHRGEFAATGECATKEGEDAREGKGGPLQVTPTKDGPVKVEGNLEIIAASGRQVATGTKQFLCRCGHSQNKPFCDGSHKKVGFEAE